MPTHSCHRSFTTAFLFVVTVAGCADATLDTAGRYGARDATGGVITLQFQGESEVHMSLGSEAGRPLYGRVLRYTRSGDALTIISDPDGGKTMSLSIEGGALVGDGLVFEKE